MMNPNAKDSIKHGYCMSKGEVQYTHAIMVGQTGSIHIDITVLQELHGLRFTMQKLIY